MDYRVDELAAATGVSVRLIRAYQSKGLLPPPRREGRKAVYSAHHRERLHEIQELKSQGHPLRIISRLLEPRPPNAPSDTAETVAERNITLRELSERTAVPVPILRSLEAAGLIRKQPSDVDTGYTEADVKAVRLLLSMIGRGLPLDEVTRIARAVRDPIDGLAADCVNLFMSHVRETIRGNGFSRKEEAERVVAALKLMLHGTTTLLAYNIQRTMLSIAFDEITRTGTRAEQNTLRREVLRRLELPLPLPG